MVLSRIDHSSSIQLGVSVALSSCLVRSLKVITTSDLLSFSEQLVLEGVYFVHMYFSGIANKSDPFKSLMSTSWKVVKTISLSTLFITLVSHASKRYRYFPLKQTMIFSAFFTGAFCLIYPLTSYMLSYFNNRFFSVEKKTETFNSTSNRTSFLPPKTHTPLYSTPLKRSFHRNSHSSQRQEDPLSLNAESLVNHCESLLANNRDASHFTEAVKKQLQEYESLNPKLVYRLFIILEKLCTDEKLDNEYNSYMGYWLLNQGIVIEHFYEYYGAMQRILIKIATDSICNLQDLFDSNNEALNAYHHLFTQTNEGFQGLPLKHQIFLNSQFFEKKGAESCCNFKLIDIENEFDKSLSSAKFLQVLHHQLCVRTQDIEKIQPDETRTLIKHSIDKMGLTRKKK